MNRKSSPSTILSFILSFGTKAGYLAFPPLLIKDINFRQTVMFCPNREKKSGRNCIFSKIPKRQLNPSFNSLLNLLSENECNSDFEAISRSKPEGGDGGYGLVCSCFWKEVVKTPYRDGFPLPKPQNCQRLPKVVSITERF